MPYKNKRILITGGTGSCGHQLIHALQQRQPKEIIVYSRDEKKHFDMQYELRSFSSISFMIGDVRDAARLREAAEGVDVIFHTAAMKHVNQCQNNPFEAVKTNVLGAKNVVDAALAANVKTVVALSTDKAVAPVNTMGMTKAVAERIIVDANRSPLNHGTNFCCVRYGNVMNSRGSVIPFFRHLIATKGEVPITDVGMTRFMLTLGDAIELIFYAARTTKGGEIFVRKAPAVNIKDLAEVIFEEQKKQMRYKEIGIFPGEKIHEVLISESEMARTSEAEDYFIIHPSEKNAAAKQKRPEYSSKESLVPKETIPDLLKRADKEYSQSHTQADMFKDA